MVFMYCYTRKRRKVSLSNQQRTCSANSGRNPEKYSHDNEDMKPIVVTSAVDGDSSSGVIRRSKISLSSLASASFHTEEEKSDHTDKEESLNEEEHNFAYTSHSDCMTIPPYDSHRSSVLPLGMQTPENYMNDLNPSPMAITRRSSPLGHTTSNSSASYYTLASGDTGYQSTSTSGKPSVGSLASSTSMRRPMTMGSAVGRVYSTGQPQFHHHYHHHHRYGGESRRESLVSSYGTGTSTRTSARTSTSNDNRFSSSTIASTSGMFALSAEREIEIPH